MYRKHHIKSCCFYGRLHPCFLLLLWSYSTKKQAMGKKKNEPSILTVSALVEKELLRLFIIKFSKKERENVGMPQQKLVHVQLLL